MPMSHHLAAIMFTDIAGYTALMGDDEKKAFELLKKNRELQKPLIEKYNGRWLKEMGDGVLASFNSASDAVYCASEIQEKCQQQEDLKLRIGIHIGEVVFENNDVFGDGVNIASRIQAQAPIGGIWISESVYTNISNKKDIKTAFVKSATLKNVKDAIRIYKIIQTDNDQYKQAIQKTGQKLFESNVIRNNTQIPIIIITGIVILTSGYFLFNNIQKNENDKGKNNSIAVLYFENMSGDPEQEYFSDGITEEISTHLTKIKGLRVISRNSVLRYKEKSLNLNQIADALNVTSVLTGSVRKFENTIRINVQLIKAGSDEYIWAETFDREQKDILGVQSEIARIIARKLEFDISKEADLKISEQATLNIEAYDQFQKGIFFLYKKYINSEKAEDFDKAKKYFESAIHLDPGYAEAYAGLAELYDELRNKSIENFPEELLTVKVNLARKAFQLNPNSAIANTAMVWAHVNHPQPNPDSGYYYAKRAYELDPTNSLMIFNLSYILSELFGLNDKAIPLMIKAIKADPLDPNHYVLLGAQNAMLGKKIEAKKNFQTSIELTNDLIQQEFPLLIWLIYHGDINTAEKRLAASGRERFLYVRSFLFAAKGEKEKINPVHRKDLNMILILNRNKILKDVIERLEIEIDKGNNRYTFNYDFLRTSYYFDAYRNDPNFKRVLAKAKKNQEKNLNKYGNIEFLE